MLRFVVAAFVVTLLNHTSVQAQTLPGEHRVLEDGGLIGSDLVRDGQNFWRPALTWGRGGTSAGLALPYAGTYFMAGPAWNLTAGPRMDIRPVIELRAGDEILTSVGAGVTGDFVTRDESLARESVTGQRYQVIYRSGPGISFIVGGDLALESGSSYLPEDRGYQLTNHRKRVRAGVHWQGENTSVFYGVSYLGKEFKAQPEGQVVGSVRLKLSF